MGENDHPWGREAKCSCALLGRGRIIFEEGSSSGQKPRMLGLELDFRQAAALLGFDAAAGRVSGTRTAALPGFVEIPARGVGMNAPAKEGNSIFGLWAVWKLLQ